MKRIIQLGILLWVLPIVSVYAEKESETIKKRMWTTEAFSDVDIPEKYSKASCIIMNRLFEYEIKGGLGASYVEVITSYHKRLKLQDKAGVAEFSSFSFTGDMKQGFFKKKSNEMAFAGFKVIKSNGEEIEIDINALLVTEETKKGKSKEVINKVSIPDLEPGDILDYYIVNKYKSTGKYITYIGESFELPLCDTYPIIEQSVIVKAGKNCYINGRSINGAPKLEATGRSKRHPVYKLVDKSRDAIKDEKFVNYKMDLPFVKLQGAFSCRPHRKGLSLSYSFFFDKPGRIKDQIYQDELENFVKYITGAIYIGINSKKRSENFETLEQKVFRIYDEVKRSYQGVTDKNSFLKEDHFGFYNRQNEGFINYLSALLKKYKVPHSIILTTDKSEIRLEDLFMRDDIYALIRIDCEKPIYLTDPNPFTVVSDINPYFAGNNAYQIQYYPKPKDKGLKPCPIFEYDHLNNNSNVLLDATLSFDSLKVDIDITQSLKKAIRNSMEYNLVNKFDFIEDYQKHFAGEIEDGKDLKSKDQSVVDDSKKELIREREEFIKDYIKDEYALDKEFNLKSFEILNLGLFNEENVFSYKINGSFEGLISKVGRNYLLDAGKLIASQVSLSEEEKNKREYNIYINYPRSYDNTIIINIPDGYKVKGLDVFNTDVKTTVGGFYSKAIQDGNKIIITTNKYYAKATSDKSLWKEYLPFINEAFNISQKQILFERL